MTELTWPSRVVSQGLPGERVMYIRRVNGVEGRRLYQGPQLSGSGW